MFYSMQTPLAVAGRVLLALIFILSAFGKMSGFDGNVGYVVSKGLPFPQIAVALAAAVELLAGVALVLGWRTKWAALLLACYCLTTALLFHNFWAVPLAQMAGQSEVHLQMELPGKLWK